jgi:hypothetical protein
VCLRCTSIRLLLNWLVQLAGCATRRQHQVDLLQQHFALDYGQVVPQEHLVFGNYTVPGAEPKVSVYACVRHVTGCCT